MLTGGHSVTVLSSEFVPNIGSKGYRHFGTGSMVSMCACLCASRVPRAYSARCGRCLPPTSLSPTSHTPHSAHRCPTPRPSCASHWRRACLSRGTSVASHAARLLHATRRTLAFATTVTRDAQMDIPDQRQDEESRAQWPSHRFPQGLRGDGCMGPWENGVLAVALSDVRHAPSLARAETGLQPAGERARAGADCWLKHGASAGGCVRAGAVRLHER